MEIHMVDGARWISAIKRRSCVSLIIRPELDDSEMDRFLSEKIELRTGSGKKAYRHHTGIFIFSDLPQGLHRIDLISDGYVRQTIWAPIGDSSIPLEKTIPFQPIPYVTDVNSTSGNEAAGIIVPFIQGTVLNKETGVPLEGVSVWIERIDFLAPDIYKLTKTNVAGEYKFTFPDLKQGGLKININFQAREYQKETRTNILSLDNREILKPVKLAKRSGY